LFKIKAPARRAYTPEGHVKKITRGICIIFRGVFFENNPREIGSAFHRAGAETCPPSVDWTKRPFMDGH